MLLGSPPLMGGPVGHAPHMGMMGVVPLGGAPRPRGGFGAGNGVGPLAAS
jgi:hypothetical protein